MNKLLPKIVIPVVVVAVGAAGAALIIRAKPEPQSRIPERVAPLVRVLPVEVETVTFRVRSQGTVMPRSEGQLAAEVPGRIIELSQSLAAGGFFRRGDVLVRIDPADARQAVAQAEANLALYRRRLAEEQAAADVARQEWDDLGGGPASPLRLRQPQLAEARASIEAAEAALERARRDLERTAVRAPYDGRVRRKLVDVGGYAGPGTPLAAIYAVDYAEVRLPLPDDELAHVDLPLAYSDGGDGGPRPRVILRAEFAGRTHEWQGRIVRTEGDIDARSRMVTAVARVEQPYGRGDDPRRPPLAVGLFVDAEIIGRTVEGAARVPRQAVREGNRVLVVDDENRIRFRDVTIGRWNENEAIVVAGLAAGERVCLSNLSVVTDGMQVRIAAEGEDG